MTESFIQEVRFLQAGAKSIVPQAYDTLELLSKTYRLAIISNSSRNEVLHLLDGLKPAMRTLNVAKDPGCKGCSR